MDKISLRVLTGDGAAFEQMVESIRVPTIFGSVGILAGHAEMLCAVEAGLLRCRWSEGSAQIRVGAGVLNVDHDQVTLLVSQAEVLEG